MKQLSNFDKLLEDYVNGNLTGVALENVEAWLEKNQKSQQPDFVWSKKDEEVLYQMMVSKRSRRAELLAYEPTAEAASDKEISITKNFYPSLLRVAAVLVVLVVAFFALKLSLPTAPEMQRYTAEKSIEKVLLDDGTIVWLKQGASLTYDPTNARAVSLEGEGVFEVAKDPAHPFTIQCGVIVAKVLGTSFNLRSSLRSLELTVFTGKVNLSTEGDERGINVLPNEKISFDASRGGIARSRVDASVVRDLVVDTEYDMAFDEVEIKTVFEKLEKKFDMTLDVKQTEMLHCKINADLTDKSLERSLELLRDVLAFEFEIRDRVVLISGGGCR